MSTVSPPAVTTGTEGGKGKKVRVKKESIGEEGEKDKPYKCDICVKRYARRDYLERHLLNHEARSYSCQACGKGFARVDVLKKHELNACKAKSEMINQDETLIPRTSMERGSGMLDRDRRMGKETFRDFPIPGSTPRPVSRLPSQHLDHDRDHRVSSATVWKERKRPLSRSSSEGEEDESVPERRYRPQYPQYPGEYTPSQRYQPPSIAFHHETPNFPMPTISPTQPDQPGDMSLSLAPAYAPTPIPPSPIPTPQENTDFEMPGKGGGDMDDLLSWLFNSNTGGDWSGQDTGGHQYLPNFSEPIASEQEIIDTTDQNPAYYHYEPSTTTSTAQVQAITTSSGQVSMPNAEAGPSGQHKRYPQPVHPLYIPNIPGKTSIPTFTGGGARDRESQRYKEVIDEDVKADMMDMFERPGKEALSSPAFSIHRMRLYLELYFMHFAPLYPIIHQPSLLYRRLPPDLLLALICIGTAFAEDKEGLRIASFLHKRLRNRIFEMVEDEPKASVHNLQTLLLINHFSRSYCSLKEHAISQIFHSPSVYMIRLAGTLLPRFNRQNAPSDDPLTCWLDWVGEEERKRLGWFAFMMDLENAALYRHFLMIHCYFMEIPFPTSSASWTAKDPYEWSTHLRSSLSIPTPSFRSALRELAGRGNIPPNLNDQSLWILIHGLINVSWTLLWRDLGELSMVHENKITGWKDSLRRAFGVWVRYVEARYSAGGMEEALYTVGIPFAQLGSILLLSDTEMIRIFAGAANIAGRAISPGEWTAANTYVHAWAKSQDGAYACYTAIELLHQIYRWSAEDRWATAPAFIPWCTYVSSLIIWAYSTVLDGPDALQAPYIIPTAKSHTLKHGQSSEIIIEPSLARRAAQIYLGDMLAQCRGEVFALPDVRGKNACAGILAYTAHLVGIGGRGVLEEARRVLLGLLGEG